MAFCIISITTQSLLFNDSVVLWRTYQAEAGSLSWALCQYFAGWPCISASLFWVTILPTRQRSSGHIQRSSVQINEWGTVRLENVKGCLLRAYLSPKLVSRGLKRESLPY